MSAARYVGRVGGLAAALGAGAAILIGSGVASADSTSDKSTDSTSPAASGAPSASTATPKAGKVDGHKHSRVDRDPGKVTGVAKPTTKAKDAGIPRPPRMLTPTRPASAPAGADSALPSPDAAPTTPSTPTGTAAATEVVKEIVQDVPASAKTAPPTTPKDTGTTDAIALTSLVGTSTPAPAASTQPKVSATTSAVAALVMSKPAAPLATSPITVDPEVKVTDGVITGTTGATDSRGSRSPTQSRPGPTRGARSTSTTTDGSFYYIPDSAVVNTKGSEKFTVTVTESTPQVEEALAYAASQSPEAAAWLSKLIVSLRNNNRFWAMH